ncbi:MAG: tryptophan-rich sensory protein [Hyphomicrobiaceae bacterium]|nr:tryptophan-rich sensory protein [Hyphomicrobiaceae bacterium]
MSASLGNWLALAVFLALCFGVAYFGAQFAPGEWHAALEKPPWNPPNWVFGPVWTVLYIMIAVAGWLIWKSAPTSAAMGFWVAQLAFNAAWSWLFFGLHRMDVAFADIILLWLAIVAFIIAAWPISVMAALLFVPYLIWVSFASALNYSIWSLNG